MTWIDLIDKHFMELFILVIAVTAIYGVQNITAILLGKVKKKD